MEPSESDGRDEETEPSGMGSDGESRPAPMRAKAEQKTILLVSPKWSAPRRGDAAGPRAAVEAAQSRTTADIARGLIMPRPTAR